MTDIPQTRQQIDALDDQLMQLIRERVRLSTAIQQERLAHGGTRLALQRGGEVLDRWHAALDRPGVAVARALLELSRGPAGLAS